MCGRRSYASIYNTPFNVQNITIYSQKYHIFRLRPCNGIYLYRKHVQQYHSYEDMIRSPTHIWNKWTPALGTSILFFIYKQQWNIEKTAIHHRPIRDIQWGSTVRQHTANLFCRLLYQSRKLKYCSRGDCFCSRISLFKLTFWMQFQWFTPSVRS